MTGLFFVQKWRFFFKHLPILQKKNNIFTIPYVFLYLYLCRLRKKKLFSSSFKFTVVLVRAAKKTRCRIMAPVPPFWDICQWQNFPGNLNTWPNTSSKRFFCLPFLQPKKNVQKSMLLHWCCPSRLHKLKRRLFVHLYRIFKLDLQVL